MNSIDEAVEAFEPYKFWDLKTVNRNPEPAFLVRFGTTGNA